MTKLKEMNIEVSNHMTMLEDEVVNKLDNEKRKENIYNICMSHNISEN